MSNVLRLDLGDGRQLALMVDDAGLLTWAVVVPHPIGDQILAAGTCADVLALARVKVWAQDEMRRVAVPEPEATPNGTPLPQEIRR